MVFEMRVMLSFRLQRLCVFLMHSHFFLFFLKNVCTFAAGMFPKIEKGMNNANRGED